MSESAAVIVDTIKEEIKSLTDEQIETIFNDASLKETVTLNWRSYLHLLDTFRATDELSKVVDLILNMAEICMDNPPPSPEDFKGPMLTLLTWLAADALVSQKTNGQQCLKGEILLPLHLRKAGFDYLCDCGRVTDEIGRFLKESIKEISKGAGEGLMDLIINSANAEGEELAEINQKIGATLSAIEEEQNQQLIEKIKVAVGTLETDESFKTFCVTQMEAEFYKFAQGLFEDKPELIQDLALIRQAYLDGDALMKNPYEEFLIAFGLESCARKIANFKLGLVDCGLPDRISDTLKICRGALKRPNSGKSASPKRQKTQSLNDVD